MEAIWVDNFYVNGKLQIDDNCEIIVTNLIELPELTIALGKASTPLPAISPTIKTAADRTLSPFLSSLLANDTPSS